MNLAWLLLACVPAFADKIIDNGCHATPVTVVWCHNDKHGNPPPRFSCPYGYDILGQAFVFKGVYYWAGGGELDDMDKRITVQTQPPSTWPGPVSACVGVHKGGPRQYGSKTVMRDDTIKIPAWFGEKMGTPLGQPLDGGGPSAGDEGAGGQGSVLVVGGGERPAIDDSLSRATADGSGDFDAPVGDSAAPPPLGPAQPQAAAKVSPPPPPPQPEPSPSPAPRPPVSANRSAPTAVQTNGDAAARVDFSGQAKDGEPALLPPILPGPTTIDSSTRH